MNPSICLATIQIAWSGRDQPNYGAQARLPFPEPSHHNCEDNDRAPVGVDAEGHDGDGDHRTTRPDLEVAGIDLQAAIHHQASELPVGRDPGVAIIGLEHVAETGKGKVEAEHSDAISGCSVKDALAGGKSRLLVAVWPRKPGLIDIDDWMVGEIRCQQQLVASGMDEEGRHAGRVTGCGDGRQAWHDLDAGLVEFNLVHDRLETVLDIRCEAYAKLLRYRHVGEIGIGANEEVPVGLRNENRGTWEGFAAACSSQIADMVGMGVRNDDRIDVPRTESDRREVIEDVATIRAHGLAGTSLDENPPTAGFD